MLECLRLASSWRRRPRAPRRWRPQSRRRRAGATPSYQRWAPVYRGSCAGITQAPGGTGKQMRQEDLEEAGKSLDESDIEYLPAMSVETTSQASSNTSGHNKSLAVSLPGAHGAAVPQQVSPAVDHLESPPPSSSCVMMTIALVGASASLLRSMIGWANPENEYARQNYIGGIGFQDIAPEMRAEWYPLFLHPTMLATACKKLREKTLHSHDLMYNFSAMQDRSQPSSGQLYHWQLLRKCVTALGKIVGSHAPDPKIVNGDKTYFCAVCGYWFNANVESERHKTGKGCIPSRELHAAAAAAAAAATATAATTAATAAASSKRQRTDDGSTIVSAAADTGAAHAADPVNPSPSETQHIDDSAKSVSHNETGKPVSPW
jgi:hypothetical protein